MEDNLPARIIEKKDKTLEYYDVKFELKGDSRKLLRDKTVKKFLEEKKGYWKDGIKHVTMYIYYVETIASEDVIVYLLRPTYLNKGIDFQVWVEDVMEVDDATFRPSYKDIFDDLRIKLSENPKQFPLLIKAIGKVWDCEEPDEVLKNSNFDFKKGCSVELLLKTLKWLFIEQDITYWNYDGRAMLKIGIYKEFGIKH